jgi:hypothetical protein
MGKTALAERVGIVLHLVDKENKPAEIVRSFKISGDFPKDQGIEVIFDFAKDSDGVEVVHLTRRTSNKNRERKTWTLSAIADRDSKGLQGFTQFADSLGIKGAQLAKLIEAL